MTTDADFKRRVRQRMSRTGESYSTARARLLARRSTNGDAPAGRQTVAALGITLSLPRYWIELGSHAPGEVLHMGPPRSIFAGIAALLDDRSRGWLHDIGNPMGGVRVFRYALEGGADVDVDAASMRGRAQLEGEGYFEAQTRMAFVDDRPAIELSARRRDRLGRTWTLRQIYVLGPDSALYVVVLATFDEERDGDLLGALLDGVLLR